MWLRVVEAWLTARLLSSPAFHRVVQTVHKKVHEIRHGPFDDPEEPTHGDINNTTTDRDEPNAKNFFEHYIEEIKDQFRGRHGGSTPKK